MGFDERRLDIWEAHIEQAVSKCAQLEQCDEDILDRYYDDQAITDNSAHEVVHFEPFGIPHKRIGETSLPSWLAMTALEQLPRRQFCLDNDILLALSPGLFPDIQVLKPMFDLVGDPVEHVGGTVNFACEFKERMFEAAVTMNSIRPGTGRKCFFTMLPPSLLPIRGSGPSFGKVVVLVADPRYLVMRQLPIWEALHRGAGFGLKRLHASDFLKNYLQSDSHLGGFELQRLAMWAIEAYRQPEKIKIVFIEDFITEPTTTMQGLSRFLGVPQDETLQTAEGQLLAQKDFGLFFPCKNMPEMGHLLDIVKDFEEILATLPSGVQALWQDNMAIWSTLPDPRMASLGLSMQRHSLWVGPAWWAAHSFGLCTPCSYAHRGKCRAGEACSFCHEPSHPARKRDSLKTRNRRKQQHQRLPSRTPSPR
mmetsp:Transcript_101207/g.179742  ORF Transcript_101207/g.179742 Transcript_101207/m.179742 type:complete len:422 (-) Transcript_101207:28-1293(-)